MPAEPSTFVSAADPARAAIDLTNPEIVQRVRDLTNELTLIALRAHLMEDDLPPGPANQLRELQRSVDRALRLINALSSRSVGPSS